MPRPTLHTEPVRLYALAAGLLTAIGGALVAIGEGVDPLVAIGTAIVSLGVVVGGGELGRARAYAPATVERQAALLDEVLSAEHALEGVTLADVQGDG